MVRSPWNTILIALNSPKIILVTSLFQTDFTWVFLSKVTMWHITAFEVLCQNILLLNHGFGRLMADQMFESAPFRSADLHRLPARRSVSASRAFPLLLLAPHVCRDPRSLGDACLPCRGYHGSAADDEVSGATRRKSTRSPRAGAASPSMRMWHVMSKEWRLPTCLVADSDMGRGNACLSILMSSL